MNLKDIKYSLDSRLTDSHFYRKSSSCQFPNIIYIYLLIKLTNQTYIFFRHNQEKKNRIKNLEIP